MALKQVVGYDFQTNKLDREPMQVGHPYFSDVAPHGLLIWEGRMGLTTVPVKCQTCHLYKEQEEYATALENAFGVAGEWDYEVCNSLCIRKDNYHKCLSERKLHNKLYHDAHPEARYR